MQFPFVSTQTHKYLFIKNGETDTKFKVCTAYMGYNIDVITQTILLKKKFIIMTALFIVIFDDFESKVSNLFT